MVGLRNATGRMASSASAEDRRLVTVLQDQISEARADEVEVSEQRERNHRYYTLEPFGNERRGRSAYISPDAFDVVETKKAYMKEVFLSARQPIRFTSEGSGGSQEMADQRTAYVRKQLRVNNFHRLFRDGWHDAFVAKRMVALAEWMPDSNEYQQDVPGATLDQLSAMLSQSPDILDVDPSGLTQKTDPATGVPFVSGSMVLKKDTSRVKLTLVQPECYYRDPNAAYVEDSMYAGYEEEVSRAILIERGYDPEQVSRLRAEKSYTNSSEDSSRNRHDQSGGIRQHNRPPETETLNVRRVWCYVDPSRYEEGANLNRDEIDAERLALYEIHWCDQEILKKDGKPCVYLAEEIPLFEWTEHKISHSQHGMAVTDIVAHTQRANSTLKRLVLDNQQMRNTSRYEAVQGLVRNPRELLDNNIGGVVWSKQIGSVAPLAAPELSPLTMSVIEMLDQDKEERSGVSRLAQGLQTDVLTHQNAADMVERLTNNANRRVMQAARDFAEEFYIPLAKYIFKLGVRNDKRVHTLEVAGRTVTVSPAEWDESEHDMAVHVALTPDEGLRHAQALLMLHQAQMMDPQMQMLYGVQQKHALFDEVYDALGISDTSRFLLRPDSPEFQQQMMQQQQAAQEQAQAQMMLTEAQLKLAVSQDKLAWKRLQLDSAMSQAKVADMATDNTREDDSFEHSKVVDFRELDRKDKELDIEKQQKRSVSVSQ